MSQIARSCAQKGCGRELRDGEGAYCPAHAPQGWRRLGWLGWGLGGAAAVAVACVTIPVAVVGVGMRVVGALRGRDG